MAIDGDISMGVQNILRDMPDRNTDGVRQSELDALRQEVEQASGQASARRYGPPALGVRSSNYISDENLMAWLAQKQNGLYGELRDQMDMSRTRSKLIEDLSHLKDKVDEGATPEVIVQELSLLLEAYAGTEFADEVEGLLGEPLADFTAMLGGDMSDQIAAAFHDDIAPAIESRIDALGRDDALALLEIQSLTADIREAAQLASNVLAGNNQTTNTIVGNIGR